MNRALAVSAAALLLAVPRLAAQAPATITLEPRVGVVVQATPFAWDWNEPPPEHRATWSWGHEPAVVYAFAAEVHRGDTPLRWRLEVNHMPSAGLRREDRDGPPLAQVDQPAQVSTTLASASLVVQPPSMCRGGLCPRVVLGLGAKHYRFDADLLWDDVIDGFADDQTRLSAQVGAGVVAESPRLRLTAEVTDFSSSWRPSWSEQPGRRVHDLVMTLGVGVRLR